MRLKNAKINLQLAERPFAEGGEGKLYAIVAPASHKDKVAKIYHPHKRTAERARKLNYLNEHAPTQEGATQYVVWVEDLVYEGTECLGFIMQRVEGEKLVGFALARLPKKLRTDVWDRFDVREDWHRALELRLKVCYNIAVAVGQVHHTGHYILVDLKPDNVIIQPNGSIFLVDMDSVEVIENGETLFDAPVATPEYTPPEYYREPKSKTDPTTRLEWDSFSMGVIFYQLLMGVHPYASSCHPPYDKYTGLHEKIEQNLFVHRSYKRNVFAVVPPLHLDFHSLPKLLKKTFIDCFAISQKNFSKRPTAKEWLVALKDALMEWPNVERKVFESKKKVVEIPNNASVLPLRAATSIYDRVMFPSKKEAAQMHWKDIKPFTKYVDISKPSQGVPPIILIAAGLVGLIAVLAGGAIGIIPMVGCLVVVVLMSMSDTPPLFSSKPMNVKEGERRLRHDFMEILNGHVASIEDAIPNRFLKRFQKQNKLLHIEYESEIQRLDDKYKALLRLYQIQTKPPEMDTSTVERQLTRIEKKGKHIFAAFQQSHIQAIEKASDGLNYPYYHLIELYLKLVELRKEVFQKLNGHRKSRTPVNLDNFMSTYDDYCKRLAYYRKVLEPILRELNP